MSTSISSYGRTTPEWCAIMDALRGMEGIQMKLWELTEFPECWRITALEMDVVIHCRKCELTYYLPQGYTNRERVDETLLGIGWTKKGKKGNTCITRRHRDISHLNSQGIYEEIQRLHETLQTK